MVKLLRYKQEHCFTVVITLFESTLAESRDWNEPEERVICRHLRLWTLGPRHGTVVSIHHSTPTRDLWSSTLPRMDNTVNQALQHNWSLSHTSVSNKTL